MSKSVPKILDIACPWTFGNVSPKVHPTASDEFTKSGFPAPATYSRISASKWTDIHEFIAGTRQNRPEVAADLLLLPAKIRGNCL